MENKNTTLENRKKENIKLCVVIVIVCIALVITALIVSAYTIYKESHNTNEVKVEHSIIDNETPKDTETPNNNETPKDTPNDTCNDNEINIYSQEEEKPVIYIYPEEETNIKVTLEHAGKIKTTYPKYNNGWDIVAKPDGTLVDKYGREYNYLFWEGLTNFEVTLNEGFCIKGEDTQKFLEEKLTELGLTDKEQCDFITYWLPKLENNKYNIIKFLDKEYTSKAKLSYSCDVDTEIRVYMYCVPSNKYVELKEQNFETPERKGFTVVEWGGTILD